MNGFDNNTRGFWRERAIMISLYVLFGQASCLVVLMGIIVLPLSLFSSFTVYMMYIMCVSWRNV